MAKTRAGPTAVIGMSAPHGSLPNRTGGEHVGHENSGTRTRSTLGLAAFLLVLVAALGAQAEPPSSKLPGRKPDSKEPWGAFLGKAAHMAIGRAYIVQHPTNAVFLDNASLSRVVGKGSWGTPSVFQSS
jgi:hypothetical protein